MSLALALGRRGLGQVWPGWPSVGCVIVKGDRILGRGTSDKSVPAHAETIALAQAGDAAQGATAYVTLEPCSHHGSTPPCADALIAAGVARVVVATGDPNPQVNGQGIARLRSAGVAVDQGMCQAEAEADHEGFFRLIRDGRPMLTLKLAASLDGRIATASGESKWITGPAARARVHDLRASHDAVLIGAGTARADDPDLTVRTFTPKRQPVRIVASRHLDLPLDSRLTRSARDVPLWLLHGRAADTGPWAGMGARTFEVATGGDQQLSAPAMLRALGDEGLTRVLCEGGGALAAALLEADLVDRLVVFHAGLALGAEGTPAIGALGLGRLADAPRFRLADHRAVGGDTMAVWTRAYAE